MADDDRTERTRRALLRTWSLVALAGLGGCLRLSQSDEETTPASTGTPRGTPTAARTETPAETATRGTDTATPAETPTERSDPEPTETPEPDGPPTPPGGFDDTATPEADEPATPTGSGAGPTKAEMLDWLTAANNFTGRVVNRTGRDTVRVSVGVDAGDGPYAFDPVYVSVDAGTTVQWAWTGGGAAHSVVSERGLFASETYSEAGVHFEYTFEETGNYLYYCEPHRSVGMRGVVEVV